MGKNKKTSNEKSEELFFLFTCVKNGRKYINRLFDSLLNQSEINFIHYIYDDGSEDIIDDLVESYKMKSKKLKTPIKIIYEKNPKNIGLNLSTKHCIDKCYLPYFVWIDCDNWVDKDFFKELHKTAMKNPNSIIIRTSLIYHTIDNYGHLENYKLNLYNRSCSNNYKLKSFFYKFYNFSFFAVKTEYYFEINPHNILINERSYFCDDQLIFLCLVMSDKSFAYSKKSIGHALRRNDSESNTYINIERDFVFNNYLKTCNLINVNKTKIVSDIKHILNTYSLLNNYYHSSKPSSAYKLLFDRKRFLKTNNIPKELLYKKYNTIIWIFLITLKTIKHNSVVNKIIK